MITKALGALVGGCAAMVGALAITVPANAAHCHWGPQNPGFSQWNNWYCQQNGDYVRFFEGVTTTYAYTEETDYNSSNFTTEAAVDCTDGYYYDSGEQQEGVTYGFCPSGTTVVSGVAGYGGWGLVHVW